MRIGTAQTGGTVPGAGMPPRFVSGAGTVRNNGVERPISRMVDRFLYVYSSDLTDFVEIKLGDLEGHFRDPRDPGRKLSSIACEMTVYCAGRSVGNPVCSSFSTRGTLRSNQNALFSWNEWLTLPVRYCELDRDAFVHVMIWESDDELLLPPEEEDIEAVRRRTVASPVDDYEEDNDWPAWPPSSSESMAPLLTGSAAAAATTPSGYGPATLDRGLCKTIGGDVIVWQRRLLAECSFRLFNPRSNLLRSGIIDLQMMYSHYPNPSRPLCEPWQFTADGHEDIDRLIRDYETSREALMSESQWLTPFTISTMEKLKNDRKRSQRSLFLVVQMPTVSLNGSMYDILFCERELTVTAARRWSCVGADGDPELGMDNPCEQMHHNMARNTRSNELVKTLKPSKQARAELEAILKQPPSRELLTSQRDLIWKFRYFLRKDRNALSKFLRSVNWEAPIEVAQAVQLIDEWAPMHPEDSLELLSEDFRHPAVRSYAVSRLLSASPDRLQLFLPQLVQALKYELSDAVTVDIDTAAVETSTPDGSPELVEVKESRKNTDDLASFLIQYATSYLNFANCLFWHLRVEEQSSVKEEYKEMYKQLRRHLISALETAPSPDAQLRARSLAEQEEFVAQLKKMTKAAKAVAGGRAQREQTLRELLAKNQKLAKMDGLILPIDPTFRMSQIVPERATFFSSAMMPARLSFKGIRSGEREVINDVYTVIFKEGDDLRQDQLVMQMIRLMDNILRENQMDLRMTPYAVMATGADEGFVQFIKAMPLRDVILKYGSIQDAMREFRPSAKDEFGIEADVIDNYVRSLAGYSIVCYILGIGDRHLDNLLLCENGRLFHVDFGYILGRDPKPMPPAMKITSEMMKAMGGVNSAQWTTFRTLCFEAFETLRRHANIILNLFSLMLDAGIPDIAVERDKAVSKVEQRLRLDIGGDANEQERHQFVMRLIDGSISAKMPVIVDFMHDIKQNFY